MFRKLELKLFFVGILLFIFCLGGITYGLNEDLYYLTPYIDIRNSETPTQINAKVVFVNLSPSTSPEMTVSLDSVSAVSNGYVIQSISSLQLEPIGLVLNRAGVAVDNTLIDGIRNKLAKTDSRNYNFTDSELDILRKITQKTDFVITLPRDKMIAGKKYTVKALFTFEQNGRKFVKQVEFHLTRYEPFFKKKFTYDNVNNANNPNLKDNNYTSMPTTLDFQDYDSNAAPGYQWEVGDGHFHANFDQANGGWHDDGDDYLSDLIQQGIDMGLTWMYYTPHKIYEDKGEESNPDYNVAKNYAALYSPSIEVLLSQECNHFRSYGVPGFISDKRISHVLSYNIESTSALVRNPSVTDTDPIILERDNAVDLLNDIYSRNDYNGIPVIAHPGHFFNPWGDWNSLKTTAKPNRPIGIEVTSAGYGTDSYTLNNVNELAANGYKLAFFGSSDSHELFWGDLESCSKTYLMLPQNVSGLEKRFAINHAIKEGRTVATVNGSFIDVTLNDNATVGDCLDINDPLKPVMLKVRFYGSVSESHEVYEVYLNGQRIIEQSVLNNPLNNLELNQDISQYIRSQIVSNVNSGSVYVKTIVYDIEDNLIDEVISSPIYYYTINGNFEYSGSINPYNWTFEDWSAAGRSTGTYLSSGGINATDNSKCIKIETNQDGANGLWLSNLFAVSGDTSYEFTGSYKYLDTTSYGAYVSIMTWDASGTQLNYIYSPYFTNFTVWNTFSYKFRTHPNAVKIRLIVRLAGNTGQSVLYDAVHLKLDTSETSLINGDFESQNGANPYKWSFGDWSGTGRSTGTYLTTGGINSTDKCIQIVTNQDANGVWSSTHFAVSGDTSYEFTGSYKYLNPTSYGAFVSIRALDASNAELNYISSPSFVNLTGWNTFSFKFRTHPNAVKIELDLRLAGNAGQSVLFDAVHFKLDTLETNLINGDFESQNGINPDKWGFGDWVAPGRSTGTYLSTGGINSTDKCIQIVTNQNSASGVWSSAHFAVSGDTSYEFTGSYKYLNPTSYGAFVSIRTFDALGAELTYISSSSFANVTDWNPFSFNFTTPSNAVKIELDLRLAGNTGQSVLFDAVHLKRD